MPIGETHETLAFHIEAVARGGIGGDDDSETKFYEPNSGEIITNFRIHEITRINPQGTSINVDYEPAGREYLTIESVDTKLNAEAQGLITEVFAQGEFKSKYDNVKTILQRAQTYNKRLKGVAEAEASSGENARIKADVYATVERVGTPDDLDSTAADLLRGTTVTKTVHFKDVKDNLGFRCVNHVVEGNTLKANDNKNSDRDPSVYYDLTVPKDTEVTFTVSVKTEAATDRSVKVGVWELSGDTKINQFSEKQNIDQDWKTFNASYKTTMDKSVLRAEIYWYENDATNTIIDLENTSVVYKKSF
ncbi:hypothetical protein ACXKZH_07145 [Priestia megaterium]